MDFLNEIIKHAIENYGILAICFIIFAETGLLFGFFFPGDTLLFIAGIYASNGTINIIELLVFASIAAVLGDSVGYYIGKVAGPRIFKKDDSIFLNKHHIELTEHFYEKHGPITIVIARFVGFLRTFAPVTAGAGKMKYKLFITYNVFGGVLWVCLLSLLGYFLGSKFEWIIKIADLALIVVTVGSITLAVVSILYKLFERKYIEFYEHPENSGKKKRRINFNKARASDQSFKKTPIK